MQTWHHVLEKSEPQINNINALHGPFRRLLFNSGLIVRAEVMFAWIACDARALASIAFTSWREFMLGGTGIELVTSIL